MHPSCTSLCAHPHKVQAQPTRVPLNPQEIPRCRQDNFIEPLQVNNSPYAEVHLNAHYFTFAHVIALGCWHRILELVVQFLPLVS